MKGCVSKWRYVKEESNCLWKWHWIWRSVYGGWYWMHTMTDDAYIHPSNYNFNYKMLNRRKLHWNTFYDMITRRNPSSIVELTAISIFLVIRNWIDTFLFTFCILKAFKEWQNIKYLMNKVKHKSIISCILTSGWYANQTIIFMMLTWYL